MESEVVRMKDWKGWIVCPCCGGENILEDYSAFKKMTVVRSGFIIEKSISKYECFNCQCEFKGTIERKIKK